MNRIKIYITLLIPAIPYFLMIYYPEKIDPVFRFLASSSGVYVWAILLNAFFVSVYFGVCRDVARSGIHKNWISYIKLYFIFFGVASTILIFSIGISVIKPIFYSNFGGIFLFYIWQHYATRK